MDVSRLYIENDTETGKKIINSKYRILKKIGQGQFGKVLLADDVSIQNKDEGDKIYYAIKTIKRVDKTKLITKTYLSHTTKIKREIQIMKGCQHPNVVKLYQVIDDMKYDRILLVLENCPYGELNWKNYNHYSEKAKQDGIPLAKILRDVLNGLEYLHVEKGIIHRDLKPSNLLISKDRRIKISDFGVSLILENNANDEKELGKHMGTPAFFAPELCQFVNNRYSMINDVFTRKHKIDARIDLWSLGVTLYCMIFNALPFNGLNEFDLFKNIVNQELKIPRITYHELSQSDMEELDLLVDLIKSLLSKDPAERPTLSQIKTHKFTCYDLNAEEVRMFEDFNKPYLHSSKNLKLKFKKFFKKSTPEARNNVNTGTLDIEKLEPLEDVLDSYFQDDSSLGSIEEYDSSAEEFAISSIDNNNTLSKFSEFHSLDETGSSYDSPKKLENKGKGTAHKYMPPPLSLKRLSQEFIRSNTSHSPTGSNMSYSPFVSPGTGFHSPSSPGVKSISNLSKRGIANEKENSRTYNSGTLRALSTNGTLNISNDTNKGPLLHSDLIEPPPIFGGGSHSFGYGGSIKSNSSNPSRNNSISSARSHGLTRLTSSSSSLNLNAYLTEDNINSSGAESSPNFKLDRKSNRANSSSSKESGLKYNTVMSQSVSQSNNENNDTSVSTEEDPDATLNQLSELRHYSSISDYLDSL